MVQKLQSALQMECCAIPAGILTRDGVLFTPAEVQQMSERSLQAMHANRSLRTKYDFDIAKETGKLRVYSPLRAEQSQPTTDGRRPSVRDRIAAFIASHKALKDIGGAKPSLLARLKAARSRPVKPAGESTIAPGVVLIIKAVMLGIAAVAACLSVYYLHDTLSRTNTTFVAVVLAATMVLGLLCFFELAVYFAQHKRRLLALGFLLLWLIPVCYTIFATVDANFYQYMAQESRQESANKQEAASDRTLSLLQEATRQAQAAVTRKEADIAAYKATEKPSRWYIDKLEKELTTLRTAYATAANAEIRAAQPAQQAANSRSTVVASRPSVVDFIAEKKHWDARLIKLFLSILPALYNELMAPVALAVATFLTAKAKEPSAPIYK